ISRSPLRTAPRITSRVKPSKQSTLWATVSMGPKQRLRLRLPDFHTFSGILHAPLALDAVRVRLSIHPRVARDFLDALVYLDCLDRDESGRYANVRTANLYLVPNSPTSIGGRLDHMRVHECPVWNLLTRAMQTGEPQSAGGSTGLYPALYADRK